MFPMDTFAVVCVTSDMSFFEDNVLFLIDEMFIRLSTVVLADCSLCDISVDSSVVALLISSDFEEIVDRNVFESGIDISFFCVSTIKQSFFDWISAVSEWVLLEPA